MNNFTTNEEQLFDKNVNKTVMENKIQDNELKGLYSAKGYNLKEVKETLELMGYTDRFTNIEAFKVRLAQLRDEYINWCHTNQGLFKQNKEKTFTEYKLKIAELNQKIENISLIIKPISDEVLSLNQELLKIRGKKYLFMDIIKLILSIAIVLALGFWCAFYYGSVMTLYLANGDSLINELGEIMPLFSYENMAKGYVLSFFALAFGTFAGFFHTERYTWIIFTIIDLSLAFQVEKKIEDNMELLDIPYSVDYVACARFLFIIAVGIGALVTYTFATRNMKECLEFNEYNSKKEASQAIKKELEVKDQTLKKLTEEKNNYQIELQKYENKLSIEENKDLETNWYSDSTLRTLLESYYIGWSKFLNEMQSYKNVDKKEIEKLLVDGKMTIKDTINNINTNDI